MSMTISYEKLATSSTLDKPATATFQEGHLEIYLKEIENHERAPTLCDKDVVEQSQQPTSFERGDHVSCTQHAYGKNVSMNPCIQHGMCILSIWGHVLDLEDGIPSQEPNKDINFTKVYP